MNESFIILWARNLISDRRLAKLNSYKNNDGRRRLWCPLTDSSWQINLVSVWVFTTPHNNTLSLKLEIWKRKYPSSSKKFSTHLKPCVSGTGTCMILLKCHSVIRKLQFHYYVKTNLAGICDTSKKIFLQEKNKKLKLKKFRF